MGGIVMPCCKCNKKVEAKIDGGFSMSTDKKGRHLINGKRVICPDCESMLKEFNNPEIKHCLLGSSFAEEVKLGNLEQGG